VNGAGAYLQLTKPRLLPLVLFTGLPALLMAEAQALSPGLVIATLGGTALVAGAANALNSYLERDRDALMTRTESRPLPAGALSPGRALAFGVLLAFAGTGSLWHFCGANAALIALAAIFFYVFVYTLWLKPRSRWAILAGGVSGAITPLIADAAVDGRVGAVGWLLFAIIFCWQPPHFYAIALYRKREYERAGYRMLPSRIGDEATRRRIEATRRRIVAWVATAVIPASLLTAALTPVGAVYAIAALALGGWFLIEALALLRRRTPLAARRFFWVSLAYLASLFLVMIADLGLERWIS
jgi:protoheme IX farnesyltransferase